MLRQSLSAGVDVRLVDEDEQAATGVAIISIDATGENQIIPPRAPTARPNGSRAFPRLQRQRPAAAAGDPAGHRDARGDEAQAAGVTVVLDPAPARDIPDQLLRLASYVTPNEGELARLVGAPSPTSPRWPTSTRRPRDSSLADHPRAGSSARAALD
jgi:ribokinase